MCKECQEPISKVSRVVVEEINSTDRLQSMMELGMRLNDVLDVEKAGTFGIGCGSGCDAWGIACGNNCLNGLDLTDELIRDRYAIDVLGEKDISKKEMELIQKDFSKFHDEVENALSQKLNLDNMRKRIEKYSS